jgi:hypothetical protein
MAAIYELTEDCPVSLRYSGECKTSLERVIAGKGLRGVFLRTNAKRGVVVLSLVGDPQTEVETPQSRWGLWRPVK